VSNVVEIQNALKELPLHDAQDVARWLENYLDQNGANRAPSSPQAPVRLPDYAARGKMIFGEKVLPNMVMLARERERW
jgi:hypothetical protein